MQCYGLNGFVALALGLVGCSDPQATHSEQSAFTTGISSESPETDTSPGHDEMNANHLDLLSPSGVVKEGSVQSKSGMTFELIPAGEFLMGGDQTPAEIESIMRASRALNLNDDDTRNYPQHTVRITKPFLIGTYEVTQRDWQAVMGTNPSGYSHTGFMAKEVTGMSTDDFPVELVSWYDCIDFCNRLSALEDLAPHYILTVNKQAFGSIVEAEFTVVGGEGYRLPTEAEWEYACRAGTASPFHFGGSCNGTEANCNGELPYGTSDRGPRLGRTTTVGSYPPNAFGLYDMHGNVFEWCFDAFDERAYVSRVGGGTTDPVITEGSEPGRVLRGGCWTFLAVIARSAERGWNKPGEHRSNCGFRVARTP